MKFLLASLLLVSVVDAEDVINIGSRRELLIDDFLIDRHEGAEFKPHKPKDREVVITCDAPWEGNTSAYYTLFQDGDLFRMYYRGAHFDEKTKKEAHSEFTCYAESRDGIAWTKPELGLFEFNGSKANNIIHTGEGSHNFSPFKDESPNCSADARYKAFAGGYTMLKGKKKSCLYAYKSADGVHWSKLSEDAAITDGAFDSQNIGFYDAVRGEYRAYWRYFASAHTDKSGKKIEGIRAIRTATSKDFIHWEHQADLAYPGSPDEHLYTNAVRTYDRAPQLFIGFPTRFQPAHQQVEPVFMSSRDGVSFKRWNDPLIPITAPKDRDGNRSNYMTRGLLRLHPDDHELSVYATEAYYTGPGSRLRRFTFRVDGFVSMNAEKGEVLTKQLTFAGSRLLLNIESQGESRVEVQDADGKALPGFALDDCTPIKGDVLDGSVTWKGGSLASLAGKAVRLRFLLNGADLYAFKFSE